ncbi:transposase [Streptomyces sp. LN699]|uniref:transposase n=1 Tax=Streptomyces sp. LN699 TaxID=3112981 RepID=UPI00371C92C8
MMFIVESVGKEEACPRCSFTPEFKVESVEVCRRGDRSVGQVAKGFDLTEAAVRDWVRQAQVDAGEREGRRNSTPGFRGVRDAEPTEYITTVHERSRSTCGAPRGPAGTAGAATAPRFLTHTR